MALLYLPPQVFDANGNPAAGAKYKFYDAAAHSTPKSAYSDSGLTVPIASLTADSGGYFNQAFASQNSAYYVTLETSGGVIFKTFDQVTGLGTDSSGALSQTFADARWKVSSGLTDGVNQGVNDESGHPSPTNTGGYRRIGGWALTQGETLTLDHSLVNATGRYKEQGYKIPGVVRSEAVTFSAAATVDIPLTNDPTGCLAWEIEVIQLTQSTQANLRLRLSYDNGATYKSGAADYDSQLIYASAGGALTCGGLAGQAYADMTVSSKTPANKSGLIRIWANTPNSGADATLVTGRVLTYDGAGVPMSSDFYASGIGGYGRATHLRLYPVSGTITGLYRVKPQRGFGET
jgi:hypothetical protein